MVGVTDFAANEPGVNGHSERLKRGRITKVKRPDFQRAFLSVARGDFTDVPRGFREDSRSDCGMSGGQLYDQTR
jgi:hypothetical protein